LSASEPETPKPDSVVAQEVTNALDNLKAENKKLTQELAQTKWQYMELLENSAATIGNLQKELEEARSQLAAANQEISGRDTKIQNLESKLAELEQDPQPQHQLHKKIKELEERNRLLCIKSREEWQKLEEEIKILKYRGESQGRRLAEKQNRLDELESAAELLQQNPAPAIDLSDKAGEVASYIKTLLCDEKLLNSTLTKIKRNKQVQLPKEVISKVEQILSDNDKKPPTDARELLNEG